MADLPRSHPAQIFKSEIIGLKKRLAWLSEKLTERYIQVQAEKDPMLRAELAASFEQASWAQERAVLAIEVLTGESFIGVERKKFPHSCAFCLKLVEKDNL